jgi:hypothetical protein
MRLRGHSNQAGAAWVRATPPIVDPRQLAGALNKTGVSEDVVTEAFATRLRV